MDREWLQKNLNEMGKPKFADISDDVGDSPEMKVLLRKRNVVLESGPRPSGSGEWKNIVAFYVLNPKEMAGLELKDQLALVMQKRTDALKKLIPEFSVAFLKQAAPRTDAALWRFILLRGWCLRETVLPRMAGHEDDNGIVVSIDTTFDFKFAGQPAADPFLIFDEYGNAMQPG